MNFEDLLLAIDDYKKSRDVYENPQTDCDFGSDEWNQYKEALHQMNKVFRLLSFLAMFH